MTPVLYNRIGLCLRDMWVMTYVSDSMQAMLHMVTSWNGSIFRVTGPLWGESIGDRWFPLQSPVTRSFDVFFDLRLNETTETPVIRGRFALIIASM